MGQILENGYEMKTTFWQDFTIADLFGLDAVQQTYNNAFKEWKKDTVYITELALVVNWKCWQHYNKNNMAMYELYHDLYYKTRDWCLNHLKGKDLKYYIDTTD